MTRDEDRLVAAIADLTNQVSRVAWALEVRATQFQAEFQDAPCSRCLSQLVPVDVDKCPSCYEPTKEKPDA